MIPPRVTAIAAGRAIEEVWRNELGGLTYAVGDAFVKWSPPGLPLEPERARLQWAIGYVCVPRVLDHGSDADGSWLVTQALPGTSAVLPRWKLDPARTVAAIGRGLRGFHDALPVATCPFSWSIEDRLAALRERGPIASPDRKLPDVALGQSPPIDRLVVCHGDTCAPNTLLGDDGSCAGHVDLGALGVADRWADLAIATWSLEWNYGAGWDRALLDAYGIAPDPERTHYYRLLWDLG